MILFEALGVKKTPLRFEFKWTVSVISTPHSNILYPLNGA